MGVVAFDYGAWSARYPELAAGVPQSQATLYFAEACLYCDNTPASPVADDSPGGQRALFLNMITAHIAALTASTLVGRILEAEEGSVLVKTENQYPPGSAQWWQQSRYGAAFWAASQQYRAMRYVP